MGSAGWSVVMVCVEILGRGYLGTLTVDDIRLYRLTNGCCNHVVSTGNEKITKVCTNERIDVLDLGPF